jgi:GMP synthase-like glutamine amidotransferase
MKRALVLQHVPHEGPGRIRDLLAEQHVEVNVCRLDLGHPAPGLNDLALLVVMGGPMGVGDVTDPRFPFLAEELRLLQAACAAELPTLGICLGAQLLAHVLGARVHPNELGIPPLRAREVGWGAMALHHAADSRGLLRGLQAAEMMFHWHGDTFDLPPGAEWLASTLYCRHQMFRHKSLVGLQFHPELTRADIECLLEADADYARATLGADAATRVREDTLRFFAEYRRTGDVLLRNLLGVLLAA